MLKILMHQIKIIFKYFSNGINSRLHSVKGGSSC
jgi:hypothetical protein